MKAPEVTIMMEEYQRAYQADDGIKIANGESISIIVHEIGHYLENNYGELWVDAVAHRRCRGFEAGNSSTAVENDKLMKNGW